MNDLAIFYQLAPANVKLEINLIQATTKPNSKERLKRIAEIFMREAQKHGGKKAAREMREILNDNFGLEEA